ncbi:hypothetical protein SEA_DIRKDIRK_90 [Mycobacterium phage DirkDirk]|uniref:Uncharacterized protein n=1 Tax=Mycobacterium phage DirkDirk TaxID=2664225 RepID=A0A5Q2WCS9_9CAUD|nr:hypothetical protein KNU85_gp090 [Mycobacterium phage DirkDirk]QGH75200.1 hypothetical protein SEA_DIRKDIRK_90 [Mycobacterium phage DirkDirk]
MTTRDAVNPSHYKDGWSDGAQLISISENLTGNGAQAVQYIARATRLDPSLTKGDTDSELVEDLKKAKWFVEREIARIERRIKDAALRPGDSPKITINPIMPPVDLDVYFKSLASHPQGFA